MYNIKAIATTYAQVSFRSRLEARWAAFFDLVGWRWSYEPLDFDGWIPDFLLHGKNQSILVEVKPIFSADDRLFSQLSRCALRARSRNDILVLGADIIPEARYWTCCAFGWLGEFSGTEHHGWGEAIPHDGGDALGFCHNILSFRNRITGYHDGDSGAGSEGCDAVIQRMWREAGNIVQWQADSALPDPVCAAA